jgi:hypothetical protein
MRAESGERSIIMNRGLPIRNITRSQLDKYRRGAKLFPVPGSTLFYGLDMSEPMTRLIYST